MKPKLLLSILAAVGTLHAIPARSVAADALTLTNPGFEEELNGWDNQDDGGMSKVVPEAAHTGKFGLRVTDDSEQAGSSLYSQKIPVSAGKTYEVQFWSQTVSGTGAGVYLRFVGVDGRIISPTTEEEKTADRAPVVEVDKNQSGWRLWSGKRTAPSGAVAVKIYIHSYSKHKVTADFDDFVITEPAK